MADQATQVAADVLSKLVQFLIVRSAREFGYLIHYRSNIDMLKQQRGKLIAKSNGRRSEVDEERRKGRFISDEAKLWFDKLKELLDEAERFLQSTTGENNMCLNGRCPNIKKCYKLGKEAKMKAKEVSDLEKEAVNTITVSPPPLSVGTKSTGTFKHFDSRKPTLEKLKELLNAGESKMIGVCGMGGSGKTTMVEEIARQVKGDKFDEIVWGTVSEKPDFIGIQDQIANYLGFEFKNRTSANVRADELYGRLLQSEKQNLIVLDDVWQCFDLVKDIGIPFGVENKKCKVVLTSRDKGVCEAMKCMDILEINALLYEEAWTLFRDTVGDSVCNPDVHETASQIVQKCGGLPIAIVVLGKSLKGKRVEVWNNTLLKLQKASVPSNIKGMKEGVYQSLKSSYDLLEDKEAKKLFLLCCLFPEDSNIELDELFRYGMGLDLFEDGEYITEARCSLITFIEQLKACYLLLDGSHEFAVKVHDIVRVVGLSITAATEHTEHDVEFREIAIHGQQLPNSATYQHYNAISVVSDKIKELPVDGLNCPKLEVLEISCRNLSEEFFNSVFEGMKGLKVVDIWGMGMPLLPSSLLSLANLRVLFLDCGLSTERFNITEGLVNLEILTLVGVEELPKEIGNLAKLRLLDLSRCYRLRKIPAGVLACLKLLAELHMGGTYWRNEENGGSPAILTEVEALPNLIYLGIRVDLKFIRSCTVLTKLQRYDIAVNTQKVPHVSFFERSLSLNLSNKDTNLEGGLGKLLMDGPDNLDLKGDGLKIGLDKLVLGGHRRLRKLKVRYSNSEKVDCLAKCINTTSSFEVFTELEKLHVEKLKHLKHIVSQDGIGVAKGSFGNLRELHLSDLPAMICPITYSIAVNLVHLQKLHIKKCDKMEQVFFNPGPSGIASDGSRIVFMKLEEVVLETLDSLLFLPGDRPC